ncbi:prion-like-(Q/N-rich) domain-bearing protein 25 [Drosophila kikkawai]|uniref:Prion-like-(Q/N-rich) domain-bearing protein 25 n=1 Tax=Drosophila kikkawai TaxID=30033 RepID=A0A6P4IQU3_DROKI|nr:cell death abnormality protein 1 [Drosophila kikkawai]
MHLGLINWLLLPLLGFALLGGRAEELLELACITDVQCSQFDRGHCVDMACICSARDSEERVACLPHEEKLTNIIGGPCPCPQPNAECDSKRDQCVCHMGYVPSADRRRCLPEAVRHGGVCESLRQCQLADKFSMCLEGHCQCRSNFELHEGRCLAVLQSSCRLNTDCGTCGASLCLPKVEKCACAENYVHNRNMTKCITGSNYGSSCDHSAPCQVTLGGSAQCQDHRCTCRATHYPKRVANAVPKESDIDGDIISHKDRISCEPTVLFGAYCRHHGDCRMEPVGQDSAPVAMVCHYGECTCSDTHRLQDNQCILMVNMGATHHGAARLLPLSFACALQIFFYFLFSKQIYC